MVTYLRDILFVLLGPYQPVISTLADGTEVAQYDIQYIVTAVVFVIVLWSLLRIVGGLICSNR